MEESASFIHRVRARFDLLVSMFSLFDHWYQVPFVIALFCLHSIHVDVPFFVTIQGRRMRFPTVRELFTAKQIFLDRIYDAEDHVDPRTILDLGANIGMASVFYALRFPNANIIAYEPDPMTFAYLKENTAGLRVDCRQVAVSRYGGTVRFYHSPSLSLASALTETPGSSEIQVASVKPSDLPIADLVKIDIEGAEEFLSERDFPSTSMIVGETTDHEFIERGFPSVYWRRRDIFVRYGHPSESST